MTTFKFKKSYIRRLDDRSLKVLYKKILERDDYLSYGTAKSPNPTLRRVRDEMERRNLV